jgi:hypothetical protein
MRSFNVLTILWGVLIVGYGLPIPGNGATITRADAALRMAQRLRIADVNNKANELYGLYPGIFPGGYDGKADITMHDQPATMETVLVAIVRWAGWDTVRYDTRIAGKVKPYVSPEGFPFYAPDPTPRSIPYVVVALEKHLIQEQDLPRLRTPIDYPEIDVLCRRAQAQKAVSGSRLPLILDKAGIAELTSSRPDPSRLLILPGGFSQYTLLRGLRNRIVDLNTSSVRIFDGGSLFEDGKQDYFPLGPLETHLTVGMHVPEDSYSHQAQPIHGVVENESSTVNAVGLWGTAVSQKKNARVWGGFLDVKSPTGKDSDAQVIGLEVDVTNDTLPGSAPNRSKTGIQVVGIGSAAVTNAMEIIGAGSAKWTNGLLFAPGAIDRKGAVIGVAGPGRVGRGIDMSGVDFDDSAILLRQGSPVSFLYKSGNRSAIYTDNFGNGNLVLQAGADGLRITSYDDSKNLVQFDSRGNIITPFGSFEKVIKDVAALKQASASSGTRVASPKSSHDACTRGSWAFDADYVYTCVADNTWKRASLASW